MKNDDPTMEEQILLDITGTFEIHNTQSTHSKGPIESTTDMIFNSFPAKTLYRLIHVARSLETF
jgi:hypothetical protein